MRQEINKAIYKGVTNWKATPLVILFGRCMLERQTASVFWLYFNRTCQRVIASNQVYPYLYRVMLDIMKTYTKDSFFRELAIAFGGDGLSPERLVETVQKKALQFNPLIDKVVGQELSRYSPEEITQIVRGKMYYDLQMVRINGSLVGAVLGGIFYGLYLLIEGVLK